MTQTHIIEHEAMKTTFVLRLLSDNALLAKQVGNACIECIDTMERQLSRHYPGSDIWQVNQMQADQSLFISEDSYECLRLAFVAHKRTEDFLTSLWAVKSSTIKTRVRDPPRSSRDNS